MTANEASEQASVQGGDVPTPQGGQTLESTASMTPPAAQPKDQPKAEAKDSAKPNEDAKVWRKSDKEWQETKEKAQKVEVIEQEKLEGEQKLLSRIEQLELNNQRLAWEKRHPNVDDEKYAEPWAQIVKEKGHLVKDGHLTYDDLWKLVSREDTSAVRRTEAEQQVLSLGSVPSSSRSAPVQSGLDPTTLEMGKGWGNTQADFEKYGIR